MKATQITTDKFSTFTTLYLYDFIKQVESNEKTDIAVLEDLDIEFEYLEGRIHIWLISYENGEKEFFPVTTLNCNSILGDSARAIEELERKVGQFRRGEL